jgi:hypothetical protein
MTEQQIRFDDGAGYEQMMGIWSRFAGEILLDWLALPSGLRWIDIGCGNGAFTELLVERCSPAEVPSDRSIRRAARVCTHPTIVALGKVSPSRCHGPAFRRQQLRCGCDGIGPCVRSGPRKGRQRNGSSSCPRRGSCDLHVGHVWWQISARSNPLRDTGNGHCTNAPTTNGCVSNGSIARLVDRRRP